MVLTSLQLSHFPDLKLSVIGGKDCEAVTKTPKHEESFKIGQKISVKALHTPCHTQDSICWLMEHGDDRVVFTGDTLFIGGNVCTDDNGNDVHSLIGEKDVVGSSKERLQKCIRR